MPHGGSTRVFHPTVPRRVRMKTEAGVVLAEVRRA